MRFGTIIVGTSLLLASVCLGETVFVNTPVDGFLALRSEPSAKHGSRLYKIPHATAIDLSDCVSLSPSDRWCRTEYQGRTGWVLDKYVTRRSNGRGTGPTAGQGRQTSTLSETNAILRSVANECTPNWCSPALGNVLGGYATVEFLCKKKDCENSTAYLKKVGGKWEMVDQGTGVTPDDLVSHGFPANVARALAK